MLELLEFWLYTSAFVRISRLIPLLYRKGHDVCIRGVADFAFRVPFLRLQVSFKEEKLGSIRSELRPKLPYSRDE